MDMKELNRAICWRVPIPGGMSSYPVAFMADNEEIKARWFIYYGKENEDEVTIRIISVCTMGNDLQVDEIKTNIQITIPITPVDDPELDEHEYLNLLEKQFEHYNKAEMDKLLARVEVQPLLIAYRIAAAL